MIVAQIQSNNKFRPDGSISCHLTWSLMVLLGKEMKRLYFWYNVARDRLLQH